jgi:hypothetical protein
MKPFIFFSLLAITYVSACKPAANDDKKADTETKVGHPISVKDAERIVKNYETRAYRPMSTAKGDSLILAVDTRYVWFNKATLKVLTDQLEEDSTLTGIRFYLAAYDRDSTALCPKDYRTYSTLVMVTTYDSTFTNRAGKVVTRHFDNLKVINGNGLIFTASPENQGELCPPPNLCDQMGATLLNY